MLCACALAGGYLTSASADCEDEECDKGKYWRAGASSPYTYESWNEEGVAKMCYSNNPIGGDPEHLAERKVTFYTNGSCHCGNNAGFYPLRCNSVANDPTPEQIVNKYTDCQS